ncbi:TetR family transcriptional regulator [Streptomyces adustus]|uniref:TetR/AcrR family transcriptional regulator n=1 Tax=Streptomyces adustus TaxID=1609272 RepID=UPI0035D6D1BC
MTARPRLGRRPGESVTREAILEVARRKFADLGYDRTTMRGVAADADVDASVVSHYFGSKQGLFTAAAALPFEPEAVLAELLDGPRETIGHRLATHALRIVETTDGRLQITGLIRAAASDENAARMLRDRITGELLLPLAQELDSPDAQLRAALASSQMVGLIMARHITGLQVLADTDAAVLADAIGPTLQRYLTGPLTGAQ